MLVKDIEIFCKKTKIKKRKYGHKQYKNLPKDEKQRLAELRRFILQDEKKNNFTSSISLKKKNNNFTVSCPKEPF